MIRIQHLSKTFGDATPLRDVDCEIKKGEIVSIIGPSGAGKSTLLRCINGLERQNGGEIWIDGLNMREDSAQTRAVRRRMGMVFQSFNLFAHLMIIENLILGPTALLGVSRQAAYDEGMRLLRTVGLYEKALAYPDELSGGQKQRAAIARTLAMKPEILLFDEPTSALDPTMVGEVLSAIRNLADKGLTMLIVTHEMRFAREVSTRVFYMDEGTIYEEGAPAQIFGAPQRERTRAFVQRLKTFVFETHAKAFDFLGVNGRIEAFGQRQLLTPKQVHTIELVFEELCMNLLLPALPDAGLYLRFTVEHSDADASLALQIRYNGREFDPLWENDALPALLISRLTQDYRHAYAAGMNLICCRVG